MSPFANWWLAVLVMVFAFCRAVSSKYFHTQYDEQLYLKDSANTHLEIDGHGLVEIIYEALLNKALTAYYNDSLSIVLSFIELNSMASVQPPNIDFRLPTICEVGDTIEIRISNFNSKYFIIGKSFNSETLTYEEYVEVSKFFKPYVPPLYTSKDIYIIELNQRVSFDLNGKNKKYNLESIGLFVPADHPLNYKHIQYQICAVRWDEVKNILLKDKRSMISYNGKLVNLVDVIEDRQFLSSFLKTGFLEVGE